MLTQEIEQAEQEYEAARQKLLALRRQAEPFDVSGTVFKDGEGAPVPIEQLFGNRDELLLIHNMGGGCAYCTLWADGFNGMLPYLEDRAAFALLSNDDPAKMKNFTGSRGWKFRTVSAEGTTFAKDLGVMVDDGMIYPGVSTLKREADGRVLRTAWAPFGPGDLYCPSWHLFDLLPKGVNDWEPNYQR